MGGGLTVGDFWGVYQERLGGSNNNIQHCVNSCLLLLSPFCPHCRDSTDHPMRKLMSTAAEMHKRKLKRTRRESQLTIFTQTHRQVAGWLCDGMCHSVRVFPVLLVLMIVVWRWEIMNLRLLHQKGARHIFLKLFSPWWKTAARASYKNVTMKNKKMLAELPDGLLLQAKQQNRSPEKQLSWKWF